MSRPKQLHDLKLGEKDTITVDCGGFLESGQTLTGAPTVTIAPSTNGPTLSNKAVNTAILSDINGRNVPVGEAVQFFCDTSGVGVLAKLYTITVSCAKTGSPAPTRIVDLLLRVVS